MNQEFWLGFWDFSPFPLAAPRTGPNGQNGSQNFFQNFVGFSLEIRPPYPPIALGFAKFSSVLAHPWKSGFLRDKMARVWLFSEFFWSQNRPLWQPIYRWKFWAFLQIFDSLLLKSPWCKTNCTKICTKTLHVAAPYRRTWWPSFEFPKLILSYLNDDVIIRDKVMSFTLCLVWLLPPTRNPL